MKIWYLWHQPLQNRWYASERVQLRSDTIEVVARVEYDKALARTMKAEDLAAKTRLIADGLLDEIEKVSPGYKARLDARITKAEGEH